MATVLPKDTESRSVGARAKAIVHYTFDADHWEYRDSTGVDVGIDCSLELTEMMIGQGTYWSVKLKVDLLPSSIKQENTYRLS